MTLFNPASLSPQAIITSARAKLLALRNDLEAISDFYNWLSAQSDGDLTGLGFTVDDLQVLRSGVADAHALVQLYVSGTLPGTYTLPYAFGTSQGRVIGPQ